MFFDRNGSTNIRKIFAKCHTISGEIHQNHPSVIGRRGLLYNFIIIGHIPLIIPINRLPVKYAIIISYCPKS